MKIGLVESLSFRLWSAFPFHDQSTVSYECISLSQFEKVSIILHFN